MPEEASRRGRSSSWPRDDRLEQTIGILTGCFSHLTKGAEARDGMDEVIRGKVGAGVDSERSNAQPTAAGVGAAASAGIYPRELERPVVLRDGAYLRIRPIRPDDEPRLVDLYGRLSDYTAYQRFFTVMRRLPPTWYHFFANVDYRRRLALVAERDTATGSELVGVGRYEPSDEEGTAEVALVVQDGWQGRGLGTLLLEDVLSAAQARGIGRFLAYVLADNIRMLRLLMTRVEVLERKTEEGVVALTFTPRGDGPRQAPSLTANEPREGAGS